jgi:hypothetical protein
MCVDAVVAIPARSTHPDAAVEKQKDRCADCSVCAAVNQMQSGGVLAFDLG